MQTTFTRLSPPCSPALSDFPVKRRVPTRGVEQLWRRVTNTTSTSRVHAVTDAAVDLRAAPSEAAIDTLFGTVSGDQDEVEVEIEGEIPKWLEGSLVINGVGDYSVASHMFDGYALLFKLRMEGGRAYASHKFLETGSYRAYKEKGEMMFREFLAAPGDGGLLMIPQNLILRAFRKVLGRQATTDNCSVNVVPFGDSALAMTETSESFYNFDVDTLGLGRRATSAPPGNELATAHPHITKNGDLINVTYNVETGCSIVRMDPKTGDCQELATIPHSKNLSPCWIHDFPATDDYLALVQLPARFKLLQFLQGAQLEYGPLSWDGDEDTKISLVSLDGSGKVRTFTAPPFFAFHYGNAFESDDGKTFSFDVAMYRDPEIINDLTLDRIRGNDISESTLCRIELPIDGGSDAKVGWRCLASDTKSHGDFFDFPTINPNYTGQPHKYVYGLTAVRPTPLGNALGKLNVETGEFQIWHEPGCAASEPNFIPDPSKDDEDSGVVITLVTTPDGSSKVVFLDAKSWQVLATSTMPMKIPTRFHGHYFSKNK